MIYIQEAHPTDGWQVPNNIADAVLFAQPATDDERDAIASACVLHLDLTIPTVVDDLANATDAAYAALPDRLYVIDGEGRIAYRSAPGPFGFKSDDFETAIERCVGAGATLSHQGRWLASTPASPTTHNL